MKNKKILKGGTVTYRAETDDVIIENWHFAELPQPVYENAIREVINALRRGLHKVEKKNKEMAALKNDVRWVDNH